MTKKEAIAKIEDRLTFCLQHADEDEAILIHWIASHLAVEFGVKHLTLNSEVVLSDS
jgi:hypothetical protein